LSSGSFQILASPRIFFCAWLKITGIVNDDEKRRRGEEGKRGRGEGEKRGRGEEGKRGRGEGEKGRRGEGEKGRRGEEEKGRRGGKRGRVIEGVTERLGDGAAVWQCVSSR
jgi:hypothetical protein